MRSSTLLAVVSALAGGLTSAAACGLNQEGVPPPRDAISFPASALVDSTGNWLYVTTSNSDLRYNDGTLLAINLQKVNVALRDPWEDCPSVGYIYPRSNPDDTFCCWDRLDRTILNCDERPFIEAAATVKIGSFAAGMVSQDVCPVPNPMNPMGRPCRSAVCDPVESEEQVADQRLFIGVRGNSSITYVDVEHTKDANGEDTIEFRCGNIAQEFPECDTAHRLTTTEQNIGSAGFDPDATPVTLPDEPYALELDEDKQLLYVGHLRGDASRPGTGGISLFDVSNPTGLQRPFFAGPSGSIFPPDANGLFGVTSLTRQDIPGHAPGEVFATSRFVPRVGGIAPTEVNTCDALTQSAVLVAGDFFDTTLAGSEVRGIQFIPGPARDMETGRPIPNRAYVLQRVPPALVGFDLGSDPAGTGRITPTDVTEICGSPTFLQSHDPGGAGLRLYVTCFESGQVYVVDPFVPRVTDVIEVGRGPAGLTFGPGPAETAATPRDQVTRAYVVGFGDNNISVVDLAPGSLTENHVIMRLGFPSVAPR